MLRSVIHRSHAVLAGTSGGILCDAGLFAFRASLAVHMVALHGWSKVSNFSEIAPNFPDPLGVGTTLSLALAAAAEFGASILLLVGFATRLAAMPLLFTMLVAAFLVKSGAPWADRELALLYLSGYAALLLVGPGRWSLDAWLVGRFAGASRSGGTPAATT